ncbi:zinc finger CCCH-type with G patch domain-containing protein [Corythoichthys intestinalis]|uniref:zinc finger CCCH-type with G patch domain-containing protein n=1 Tax=Corythoichthys intestinalis TaxID=161448 RepID=UPI0025A59E39|nr:zinc finger CCCH-type with G patch domain-containing protein [Corythoichthys intestinalis]XP_057686382.1 zinc finger CCCH-type with G patch domain-containing protein [Corythoichthys intestinalis]XP_061803647.1 zinc finger CCCH-type with G patch domain-containing protein [Nerophis lumbriciformis]
MDEETLEGAISTYEAQLQQVDATLAAGLDPSQQCDLLKLKQDLCQLIELTKASLLSFQKSLLLASLENTGGVQAEAPKPDTKGDFDSEFAAFYSELGEFSGTNSETREPDQETDAGVEDKCEDEEGEEEEEETLSGTKVRAPYRTSWGTLEYHNAMVVGAEAPDGDEAQIRVLYIYPTQKSMKPCPFYLEDKCRFQDNCRFSHGEVVYVSELRDFVDCDLSNLEEGSSCLTRHEDGIWYPARITGIDNGVYTVKFDSLLLKDAVVEADCIIPPLREEDTPSSDSDPDNADDDAAYAKVLEPAGESTANTTSSFGGWEVHTRGIGSKLMLKMGYEYGKGLGKTQEGRVEPVMAVLVPKGKSLDQCAELTLRRAHGKPNDDVKTSRPKRRRKPREANGERRTVFDFLNNKLGAKQRNTAEEAAAGSPALTGVEAYKGGKSAKRSLNVRLFQAAERVSQTEREIQNLTQTLSRQTGRDASRVKQLEQKLSAARRLLAQQKAQELSIQREQNKADTHKKMTEF